ncbi:MAG: hypothetical protein A2Y78_12895 [Acidobacteria bacterium RBG_13_68_16]|nr:MAG: hypothetical protein A2Y78_12895 [Acidobacteria bacterium RBG_13_68_16]
MRKIQILAILFALLIAGSVMAQTRADIIKAGGVTTSAATVVTADNKTGPTALPVACYPFWYDGATWDRARGDATNGLLINTEMSDAAACADNFANPTTTGSMSFLMGWDSATWDRLNLGVETAAASLAVTLASDDAAVALLTTMDVDTGAMATDLAALEVLSTAANVDLAALEVLSTAANVDLAALEVLVTAGNVDLAALEVLSTAANVDLAALEVLATTIAANTSVAPTAATVSAGSAAVAADTALEAAVANTRLTMLSIHDTAAGTAAGIIRANPGAANCNTGNPIAYFGPIAAGAVFNLVTGSRDIDIAAGLCVDVTAGTMDIAWSTVVEAGP